MSSKFVFLRRTLKEIEVFGGEVYIDINGKNVAILGTTDFTYNVEPGKYKIKMYKSHTYGTFIGHAEVEITVLDGESLLIKYSPPMLVNQPGNIIISDFKSYSQADDMALEQEQKIINDDNEARQKKDEQDQKSQNTTLIFVIIMVITTIISCIILSESYW